jgi:hypothetical protein
MTGNVRLINQKQILAGENVLFGVERDLDAHKPFRPFQRERRQVATCFWRSTMKNFCSEPTKRKDK